MRWVTAAAFLSLMLASSAAFAAEPCVRQDGSAPRDVQWRSGQQKHPLIGQVFKGAEPIVVADDKCARSPFQQLMVEIWEVIRGGGVVLLGEVHDNAEHHAARGDVLWPRLDQIVPTGNLKPAAVFEHIRTSQQAQLEGFYQEAGRNPPGSATDLLRALDWKTSGWPEAEIFQPLFAAALSGRLPIHPGNAVRERMRLLVRGGDQPTDAEVVRLKLAQDLPPPLLDALTEELAGSHCGMLPASALGSMGLAQRYTDAHLAESLVNAAEKHRGAFLLAGNGHVRTDRAVPWYVHKLAPKTKAIAVMFLEVVEGKTEAGGYLPKSPEGAVAADYVVFTPRQERPDPCEKMRAGKG